MAKTRTGNAGTSRPIAAAVDVFLISLFGLTRSVMARSAFKRAWTRIIPAAAERATYVFRSSALLAVTFLFWQPIPVTIWSANGVAKAAFLAVFAIGLCLVILATFLLNHFEFTGLQQAWENLRGGPPAANEFRTPLLYRIVRHPLQLGLILTMFAVPHMTADGLLFAVAILAYMLAGLKFEERALLREFGDAYDAYRQSVPMLFPRLPSITQRR